MAKGFCTPPITVDRITDQSSNANDITSFSYTIPDKYVMAIFFVTSGGYAYNVVFNTSQGRSGTYDNGHGLAFRISYDNTTRELTVSKHSSSTQGGWAGSTLDGLTLYK